MISARKSSTEEEGQRAPQDSQQCADPVRLRFIYYPYRVKRGVVTRGVTDKRTVWSFNTSEPGPCV